MHLLIPTEDEVDAALKKANQSKPSDPVNNESHIMANVDLEGMAHHSGDYRINWGTNGNAAPSDVTEDTTPSLGPYGTDDTTPNRPE